MLLTRFSVAFAVRELEPGAGVAVGVVDPDRFDARGHVFGTAAGSWGYSSRTGKISAGGEGGWVEYGEPYKEGDIITLDISVAPTGSPNAATQLRFFKNGEAQGTAFRGPVLQTLKGQLGGGGSREGEEGEGGEGGEERPINLVPALCLGSASGGRSVRVTACHAEVREFDPLRSHHRIQFADEYSTVSNGGRWATTLAAHPGVRSGRLVWSVRLDDTRGGAGVAIGVVDARDFSVDRQNLGASDKSWCYSKTGKKGDGSGFHDYGKAYTNGDTVTLTLDMDACTLSFAINDEDQGIAYTAAHGIGRCALIPAVCLGSTEGNKMAKVSIVGARPLLRRFDRFACSKKVKLDDLYRVAETSDKWATVFLEHPGVKSGRFSFGVTIVSAGSGCGVGVGFADKDKFDPLASNLGASEGSWCFSKTGKISCGKEFVKYGAPYKTGHIITAEVDVDSEYLRFYIDGHAQDRVKVEGLRGKTLVPAVVLGSGEGGHLTRLTIGLPTVSRFDPRRMHKQMDLTDDDTTATTSQRWCTVLADHPGVTRGGMLRFAVRLEGEGGAAIGFAEPGKFRPYAQNLGASPNTWAISKTGKVSCGDAEGFRPFSEKFSGGDVIGAEADLGDGIIRFWKNGNLLGTAFARLLEGGGGCTLVPAVCLGSNSGGKASSAKLCEFEPAWLS